MSKLKLIDIDAEKRLASIALFGQQVKLNPLMFSFSSFSKCVEYANANGVQEISQPLAKELGIPIGDLMAMADNSFASIQQVESLSTKVRDLWRRRVQYEQAEKMKAQVLDFSTPFAAQTSILSPQALQAEAVAEMRAWGSGIKFGYPEFDDTTGGLMHGHLMTILAGSGTYKTTILMNMLIRGNKFNNKLKSMFFCFEMGEADAYNRMCSIATGLRVGDVIHQAIDGVDLSDALSGIYTMTKPCDVHEMAQAVRDIESEHGKIGLVVIDYLQFVRRNRVGDWVNNLMLDLKQMAKALKVAVIVLAQTDKSVNRTQNDGKRKRPNGFDALGGSGVMANSDFMWMQWRESKDTPVIGWFEKARTCHKKGGLELDYTLDMNGFCINDLVPSPQMENEDE